jgi:dsDNA-specific endonuclease/ATPase MutS2
MKVGQRAKLKDEIGEVTIVQVLGSESLVVKDEYGFDKVLPANSLIIIDDNNTFDEEAMERAGHLNVKSKDERKRPEPSFRPSSSKKRKVGERYADLHDYALPEKYHRQLHLSKLEKALSYFEDAVWEASNSSEHKLFLNHGIGEGILREEVRKRLKVRGYRYQDESYDNPGTTVVFLNDSI